MLISRNNSIFFYPQLPSLFLPLRQVALPAQRFVDERPLLGSGSWSDLVVPATSYSLCLASTRHALLHKGIFLVAVGEDGGAHEADERDVLGEEEAARVLRDGHQVDQLRHHVDAENEKKSRE
jgi:hypothetical protein